ncbi:hypothetical protein SAMN04489740_2555 [Arthrobacter alpinus]|uniref:Uncharacterized protein n=1 Tax=Arthrobacter alpinus TaxID=656366 RepID=A0A1H5LQA7_9MICC|nr:hypothetical protein SAMN04489740_2555 [Arthrobacter alpinus]
MLQKLARPMNMCESEQAITAAVPSMDVKRSAQKNAFVNGAI